MIHYWYPILFTVSNDHTYPVILCHLERLFPVDWFLFSILLTNLLKKASQNLANHIYTYKSSNRSCSVRKGVLRNLAKFTGKRLCQGLFFEKFAGLKLPFYRTPLCDWFWTYKKNWKNRKEYLVQQLDVPKNSCSKNSRKQVCIMLLLSCLY